MFCRRKDDRSIVLLCTKIVQWSRLCFVRDVPICMHATTNNKDAYVFWPGGYIQVISLYVVTYELLISEGLLSYMHTCLSNQKKKMLTFHANHRCINYHFLFWFQKNYHFFNKRINYYHFTCSSFSKVLANCWCKKRVAWACHVQPVETPAHWNAF